jgi:hypothetical protein
MLRFGTAMATASSGARNRICLARHASRRSLTRSCTVPASASIIVTSAEAARELRSRYATSSVANFSLTHCSADPLPEGLISTRSSLVSQPIPLRNRRVKASCWESSHRRTSPTRRLLTTSNPVQQVRRASAPVQQLLAASSRESVQVGPALTTCRIPSPGSRSAPGGD